jgi:hypothetical protein
MQIKSRGGRPFNIRENPADPRVKLVLSGRIYKKEGS